MPHKFTLLKPVKVVNGKGLETVKVVELRDPNGMDWIELGDPLVVLTGMDAGGEPGKAPRNFQGEQVYRNSPAWIERVAPGFDGSVLVQMHFADPKRIMDWIAAQLNITPGQEAEAGKNLDAPSGS